MSDCQDQAAVPLPVIQETVRRYWGHDRLRPLQEEAIRAGIEQRDALVVMPTGGGKSLCYQVPAILAGRTDVVVSPLIALMKDQVDGLREAGYPAAALHSGLSADERRRIEADAAAGRYRLLFVAPERLLTSWTLELCRRLPVRAFAIDEAHCISHWGHDFRPEYRQLAGLNERFPQASLHAFTATATPRVRDDIIAQLRLRDPQVLVGTFDRPNLVYRVIPRTEVYSQTLEVIRRHAGQAVIVYCLSRRDAEEMAEFLKSNRVKAAAYHAGMDADPRRRTQDAFAEEKLDVIAATVAFGMGIDRSDVRCVIHATMPKSIEHYQQETGRAGRDGLEAECVLLYSAADVIRWERLIEKSSAEAEHAAAIASAAKQLLAQMRTLCAQTVCRHKQLSEYFGQSYTQANCGACDVCLEETEGLPDSTVLAQKILSCVARVREGFGALHVVDVLLGADTERVRQHGHDQLSTYGLLKDHDKKALTHLVYQLLDQGLLGRSDGEYPVLKLNALSWEVLRGQRNVNFIQPKAGKVKRTRADVDEWAGVHRELFESLRDLRRAVADEHAVPAYVIFSDATLRELARVRPGSIETFLTVRGIGQRKAEELGERFIAHIADYCRQHELALDADAGSRAGGQPDTPRVNRSTRASFELFRKGAGLAEVAEQMGRARSTTATYLLAYIRHEKPDSIAPWVDDATYRQVAAAIDELGTAQLRPIFERFDGRISFDTIRLVAGHLAVRAG